MKFLIRKEVVTIGRSSQNDICLPNPNISRLHLTITRKDSKYIVTDKSTNGTFVNSKRIFSQELRDKDEIKIGHWIIKFSELDSEDFESQTQVISKDPTKIVSYKPEKNELLVERAFLKFESNGRKPFPIRKGVTSIGKSKSNDIVLSDDYISNYHAKIEFRGGEFFLKDLESTNGTFVNGQRIYESALTFNSMLEIGKTILRFYAENETKPVAPIKENIFMGLAAKSEKMRRIFSLISKVANSDSTVLIQGETGTGKELVARAIYKLSGRADKRFVTINCGAISKDLIESELFGHEKGAFTSAHQQRKGAFEIANGGTIFLDEIGELPLELQPKLLRVLENREIKRVGGNDLIDVDVRIIAATNKNLARELKAGKFREDLYYRLMIIPITLPPLRERREDIPLLTELFLEQEISKGKGKAQRISKQAMEILKKEKWNGNVRELKNMLARAVIECDSELIKPEHLKLSPSTLIEETSFEYNLPDFKDAKTVKTLSDVERDKIYIELKKHKWNKHETAKALGISKSTLHDKIRKYGLDPK